MASILAPATAAATEPEPEPPPEKIGIGYLTWGSLGVAMGAGTIANGLWLVWSSGAGGSGLEAAPILVGGAGIAVGAVLIHIGDRRLDSYRSWQRRTGMTRWTWRRQYQPGRPIFSGLGLILGGLASGTMGATLFGIGMDDPPRLATYEPGDASRDALWMSIHGTIGIVAGTTMVVMGSIERHRFRHWTPTRAAFRATPVPWATPTSVGLAFSGRF